MTTTLAFADGSHDSTTGIGGWAVVLRRPDGSTREVVGGTTGLTDWKPAKSRSRAALLSAIKTTYDSRRSAVSVVWSPSHRGIDGHDRADRLARAAREHLDGTGIVSADYAAEVVNAFEHGLDTGQLCTGEGR